MRKSKRRGRRLGRRAGRVAMRGRRLVKKMTPAQKARAVTRALRERFTEFKMHAKQKLALALLAAYAKGRAEALRIQDKKDSMRRKALLVAENRFEKKFAKKVLKMAKKKVRRKGRRMVAVAAMHHAAPVKRRVKRRVRRAVRRGRRRGR